MLPAPAQAGLSTWTGLPGLDAASGANWIREFATGTTPTTIYAATEGDGVYRSETNGVSWEHIAGGLDAVPGGLVVRTVFTGGGNVYAGTEAGLFKLSGSAWTPVAQGPEEDPAHPTKLNRSVQAVYGAPGQLLAGTFAGGVYRSTDGGATWTPPAPGNGMPAGETVWALAALIPNAVFAATSSGIYRSLDTGATWTPATDGISGTTLRVFADGHNPNIFYAGTAGSGMFRSINAGVTWSAINGSGTSALGPSTVRGLHQFFGDEETRIYAATSDGLWAGTTGNGPTPPGVRWRKVTQNGLDGNTILWALSSFFTTPGTLLAGTQSNGGYALTFQPPSNQVAPNANLLGNDVKVGKTLIASSGTWSGTPTIDYAYQWQQCSTSSASSCTTDIDGAEEQTYTLQAADQNKYVRVVVTASNDFPTFGLVTRASALVGPVGAKAGSLPGEVQSSTATIRVLDPGDTTLPQSGDTMWAPSQGAPDYDSGGWLFNPAASLGVSFEWYRCTDTTTASCEQVPGVSAKQYTLTDDDVDYRFRVKVKGTNSAGSTTLDYSGPTNVIFPEQATNLVAPQIFGTAQAGETLVGNVGQWKYPGTTYERQWYQCNEDGESCATLSGERNSTYTVKADDVGHRLKLIVTADSNGPNVFPAPVDVAAPVTEVVTAAPAAPGPGPEPTPGPGPGPGPTPGPVPPDTSAPTLGTVKFAGGSVKPGGSLTLSFSLSEPGSLSVRFQRLRPGHRAGRRCVAGRKRGARRCVAVKTVGTLVLRNLSGTGTVKLPARIGRKRLPAGRYRAVITPIDAAGNRGAARTLSFKVRRR